MLMTWVGVRILLKKQIDLGTRNFIPMDIQLRGSICIILSSAMYCGLDRRSCSECINEGQFSLLLC